MEFKYKDFTVYASGLNSFGDQQVTYIDPNQELVHQKINQEGSWEHERDFKAYINLLIKKTK
jgi:hypothetical protein